ncbi:MAG: phenylalanine--tRNA ligase beta subunit-related protein [Syntrophorhabdaceae bacterium]|nr:phenylalanine--tRNA ligase beta subunit-related protein [Syntrophorhabdaceae bacterium]
MRFSVDNRLFGIFPGLKIGVLVAKIENRSYGDDRLERTIEEFRKSFRYERPQEHPHIKAWRDAFSKVGISPSKYYSSIESLVRRILKGGPFPRINPVVDLYNAISLKYLVPMGCHALDNIEGDIRLCFAKGGEPFIPIEGGETEFAESDEVVYKDNREILTRRWVWRQSHKGKIEADTRDVFMPIDVLEGLPEGICENIMAELEQGLHENGYGIIIHKDILTEKKKETVFTL